MSKKVNYKSILKQKEYMKLLCANLINRFGDSIDAIALTWLIYQISNSPVLSALNYGLNFVPSALFTPFAGAFIEKRNKKVIMVLTDLGRGMIVSFIAFMTIVELLEPWMLLICTFMISTLEAFRQPCGSSVVVTLIDKDMYAHATSLSNSLSQITELIGTAVAGVIIGLIGIGWAIFIDACTFFLSALIILSIHFPKIKLPESQPALLSQFKDGLLYIRKHSSILILCMMAAIMNMGFTPFNSLQSVLVSEVYGMDSVVLSVFGVAISLGMISGSLVYPFFSEKLETPQLMFYSFLFISLFMFGCVGVVALKNQLLLFYGAIALLCFTLGFSIALMSAANSVALLKIIDASYLARVMSIFAAVAVCSIPLSSFLVSFFASFLSTELIFIGTGVIVLLFTLFMKINKIFDKIEEKEE